jgi:DNA primase
MPDQYARLRKFPLNVVLAALGFETFKYRKAGTEGYGACPVHGSKKNTTCFSFNDDGRFNCFLCSAEGRGAIGLVMAVRKCGFQQAVRILETS